MSIEKNVIQRYLSNTCTDSERVLVEQWFESLKAESTYSNQDLDDIIASLDKKIGVKKSVKMNSWRWLPYAASALLFVGLGSYLFLNKSAEMTTNALSQLTDSIYAPQENNSYIVLDNGEEYDLNSLQVGDTIRSKDVLITVLPDGSLSYVTTGMSSKVLFNTLVTGDGGTASVTLSDGTKVWLNANSKLEYPIQSLGSNREVDLEGEGYFEVAKDDKVSFLVHTATKSIKVLGTKFNVNSYKAGTEVALLEGKVVLGTADKFDVSLNPGEVYVRGNVKKEDNVERYIDWKEGYFDLGDVSLKELSEKMSNWYGVEIEVDDAVYDIELFGRISREKSLNEVLELIKESGNLDYKITNNTVYIFKPIK